jgi:hypothetical protein
MQCGWAAAHRAGLGRVVQQELLPVGGRGGADNEQGGDRPEAG